MTGPEIGPWLFRAITESAVSVESTELSIVLGSETPVILSIITAFPVCFASLSASTLLSSALCATLLALLAALAQTASARLACCQARAAVRRARVFPVPVGLSKRALLPFLQALMADAITTVCEGRGVNPGGKVTGIPERCSLLLDTAVEPRGEHSGFCISKFPSQPAPSGLPERRVCDFLFLPLFLPAAATGRRRVG